MQKVYLCKGQKVMLRHNISVKHGLVNGRIGVVKEIIYQTNCRPPQIPTAVLCFFPNYHGPSINGLVPIVKCQINPDECGCKGVTNIPLIPAYALTIHKCQGQTLSKVHVDLGKKESELGLSYVALSRVRSLSDLSLSFVPFEYFNKIKSHCHFKSRRDFYIRLLSLI